MSELRPWVVFCCVLTALVAVASRGDAQSPGEDQAAPRAPKPWSEGVPVSDKRAARALFLDGNALLDKKQLDRAAAKYKQALELWDHPAFRYNLAMVQLELDQPVAALENFRHALRYGMAPLSKGQYAEGQKFVALLNRQLARLELSCRASDAQVRLNGAFVLQCPGAHQVMLRPGRHEVAATGPGKVPFRKHVVLAAGQTLTEFIAFKARAYTRRWAAWQPWAVLSVGAVTMLGAGVVNFQATAELDELRLEFEQLCSTGCERLPDRLGSDTQRVEQRQTLSLWVLGSGGVIVLTGALLLYLNKKRWVARDGDDSVGVTVVPILGADHGYISARWRF